MANKGSSLLIGAYLGVDDYLVSDNGLYFAIMQGDGILAIYYGNGPSDQGAANRQGPSYWASNTVQREGQYFAVIQGDGNFVIYQGSDPTHQGPAYWASNTDWLRQGQYFIIMQDDGSLALYRGSDPAHQEGLICNIGTATGANKGSSLSAGEYLGSNDYLVSSNGLYFATMQADGNFVLHYGSGPSNQGPAYWTSNTASGQGQSFAIMQSDGNFVIYQGSDPTHQLIFCWNTGIVEGQSFAIMQDDGNFVIYRGSDPAHQGAFCWNTGPNPSNSIAQSVFNAINQSRADAGLSALLWDNRLARSAQLHNFAMAAANQISHQLPGEPDTSTRIKQQGVQFSVGAENCGESGYDSTQSSALGKALGLHAGMMAEQPPNDGHRQNILTTTCTHVGVAVLIGTPPDILWLTEDFAAE